MLEIMFMNPQFILLFVYSDGKLLTESCYGQIIIIIVFIFTQKR